MTVKSDSTPVDTSGWLTRQQAADLLNVSHSTIKNWDGRLLHPQKETRPLPNGGSREIWVYDPHELAKVPPAKRQRALMIPGDKGEIAGRAFELFDDGTPLRQVVTQLRETPEAVDVLHDQWTRMGGAEWVLSEAARAELGRLVGPFDGVAGLIDRLRELLSARSPAPATETTSSAPVAGPNGAR